MVQYSHVRLLILCDAAGVDIITQHLGVDPTGTDSKATVPPTKFTHTWFIDSPNTAADGEPNTRLQALADSISPFSSQLISLDERYRRFIDIVYHVTPQHVGGISGEFDWFRMSSQLMAKLGSWNLDVSYESFWFDHPDWKRLQHPWWKQLLHRIFPTTH